MAASLFSQKIAEVQQTLAEQGVDGWLLCDFRKNNDLAHRFLEIPSDVLATRRFFYWIPTHGEPIKVVHKIEGEVLKHLPGKAMAYSSWKELDFFLTQVLCGKKCVFMEYSPYNALPTISKVDGGTLDFIRSLGVEVKSSGDLLQRYTSIWSEGQFAMHRIAAAVLQTSIESAWAWIVDAVQNQKEVTEKDVQDFLLSMFEKNGCLSEDPPICAVNAHSADPHYLLSKESAALIKKGDFILIDAWCKQGKSKAVYADLTRLAILGSQPTAKQQEIFSIVKEARDAALEFLSKQLAKGNKIRGCEVDRVCREVITRHGYERYFPHRTGHNIGEKDHGEGANIDGFETYDDRFLLPGTCFSIEPGIYLPGEFGVRLEDDVYLDLNGKDFHITPGVQQSIRCLL